MCNHEEAEQDVALVDGMCPLCLAADLAALNARVEELERVRKIASEIFAVVSTGAVARTAQGCKHGNYATAPYNHAWWCDECFWELEAALKGAE